MNNVLENDQYLPAISEENAPTLHKFVNALFEKAQQCSDQPNEQTAIAACKATRIVADTAEGMALNDYAIESELLAKGINGIETCIASVSAVQLPADASPEVKTHFEKMLDAMTGRRDDLNVLFKQGRIAFFERRRNQ